MAKNLRANMKNVLIISYLYPPYNAPAARRPYSWAKYLDKEKYNIKVLTCSNPDSSLGMDVSMNVTIPNVELVSLDSILKSTIGTELRDANTVNISPGIKSKLKRFLVKIGSYFLIPDKAIFWYPNVKKYLKNNESWVKSIDVVISTSPAMTNHLLGLYIKKQYPKISLIGDLRDYHYIGHHKTHSPWPLSILHKRFEKNIIKRADGVTFISEAMRDVYAENYKKNASKFSVIYNGFDKDDFSFERSSQFTPSKKISIFYAGSFYGGVRSPKGLLQLIDWAIEDQIISLDDIEVTIAGNFEKSLQEEMTVFKSFGAVNYIGKIPRNEVIEYYQKASILWLIVGEKLSHYTGVPLKFYEYLAAQKFIMNFAPSNSESSYLIDTYNLGANFDIHKDTKSEQLLAFKKIIEKWKSDGLWIPPQDDVMATFDRKNQTKQLENLIERL